MRVLYVEDELLYETYKLWVNNLLNGFGLFIGWAFCAGVIFITVAVVLGITFNFIAFSFLLRLVKGFAKNILPFCFDNDDVKLSFPPLLDELLVILRKVFPA